MLQQACYYRVVECKMVADARAPTVFIYNFQPIRNRVETEQAAIRSLDVALQPYLSLSF